MDDGFRIIRVRKPAVYSQRLIDAVIGRDTDAVRQFFTENPDTGNMKTQKGVPILYTAIQNHSYEIAELLLENKADPNEIGKYEEEWYPLQLAIRMNDVRMAQLLCQYGADVNKRSFGSDRTPIAMAVEGGNPRMVSLLCRFDVDLDQAEGVRGKLANNYVESKDIQAILKTCRAVVAQRTGTYQKIMKHWQQVLQKEGTIYIQSQKTGQCFSDSFQFVFYYADGLRQYFIENALKQELGSSKDKKRLFVRNEPNVKRFLEKGNDLLDLYMAYTGHRFLNMVKSNPFQRVGPKRTLKRRPSVLSSHLVFNTGMMCSSIIHLYDLFQKGETYIPHSLDFDEKGNLREPAELMFLDGLLHKVPSQYGSGGVYTPDTLPENQIPYVVGVLFVLYPTDYRMSIGHAVAIVKLFGKWYLCDDNIGFAMPISMKFEELQTSSLLMDVQAGTIEYSLIPEAKHAEPIELFSYKSEDPLLNTSQSYDTMMEPTLGKSVKVSATVSSISRKYITWDPKGKAKRTNYEFTVMRPPERKLVTWKNGNATFQEYENVLEHQRYMNEQKMLAERRRREELGNVNNNAEPNGSNNEGGGRTRKNRQRK
jgi:hypothetical protein